METQTSVHIYVLEVCRTCLCNTWVFSRSSFRSDHNRVRRTSLNNRSSSVVKPAAACTSRRISFLRFIASKASLHPPGLLLGFMPAIEIDGGKSGPIQLPRTKKICGIRRKHRRQNAVKVRATNSKPRHQFATIIREQTIMGQVTSSSHDTA